MDGRKNGTNYVLTARAVFRMKTEHVTLKHIKTAMNLSCCSCVFWLVNSDFQDASHLFWLRIKFSSMGPRAIICDIKLKTILHGLSPRANYTDRVTAACRRSDCQLFADRRCHVVSVTDPYGRILRFQDRSRYFSIKYLLSCTHEAEWTPFQTHYFFFW
jgi:hypothetical protein